MSGIMRSLRCRRIGAAAAAEHTLAELRAFLACPKGNLGAAFGPSPAETIDDAIPRHTVKPGANLLDRLHQPIRFYQLVEDILQDVFSVSLVVHALPNEIEQTPTLPLNHFRNTPILLSSA